MSYIDPTNYEMAYRVADFVMGGLQMFIVPIGWTFGQSLEYVGDAVSEFIGISSGG